MTVTALVRTQGGAERRGTVTGRKGSQLLVTYTIQNGQSRERWFPKARWTDVDGDLEAVPRYVSRTCKATRLPEPVKIVDGDPSLRNRTCPECGERHHSIQRNEVTDAETGELLRATENGKHVEGDEELRCERGPAFVNGPTTAYHLRETGRDDRGCKTYERVGHRPVMLQRWLVGYSSRKLPDEIVTEPA